MTTKRRRPWVTATLFAVLFVLSQDYWTWTDSLVLWPLGLPRWVYVFAALQIGVACVVVFHLRRDSSDS